MNTKLSVLEPSELNRIKDLLNRRTREGKSEGGYILQSQSPISLAHSNLVPFQEVHPSASRRFPEKRPV